MTHLEQIQIATRHAFCNLTFSMIFEMLDRKNHQKLFKIFLLFLTINIFVYINFSIMRIAIMNLILQISLLFY